MEEWTSIGINRRATSPTVIDDNQCRTWHRDTHPFTASHTALLYSASYP